MLDDSSESDCLFSAIDCFLQEGRDRARKCEARHLWNERPLISRADTDMLMVLMQGPLCAEALSRKLQREEFSTQALLDAMVAVGVLERCGDAYRASLATALYLQSIMDDSLHSESDEVA